MRHRRRRQRHAEELPEPASDLPSTDDRIPGRVATVGPKFGFITPENGEGDFFFTVDRLPPGVRLWPGHRVTFIPLRATADTSQAKGGRPLATRVRPAE